MRASSVLVHVTGADCDEDIVRIGCEMLETRRSVLHLIYVIEMARRSPIDAEIPEDSDRGDEVLRGMEEIARGYNCVAEAHLAQARKSGAAVVRQSIENNVEAIVMGAAQTESFGEFSLGEHIPYVLRHAPCRVIIYRDRKTAAADSPSLLARAKRPF